MMIPIRLPVVRAAALVLALLLAACGASDPNAVTPLTVDLTDVAAGEFRITLTGAAEQTLTGPAPVTDGGADGQMLLFLPADEAPDARSMSVIITLPAGTQPGTYRIQSYATALDAEDKVIAIGGSFRQLTGDQADTFGEVTAGTLTLQTIAPHTGAFEFTVQSGDRSVIVRGVFNQLPVITL